MGWIDGSSEDKNHQDNEKFNVYPSVCCYFNSPDKNLFAINDELPKYIFLGIKIMMVIGMTMMILFKTKIVCTPTIFPFISGTTIIMNDSETKGCTLNLTDAIFITQIHNQHIQTKI